VNRHEAIAKLRTQVVALQAELDRLVWMGCPGQHRPTQHRDGKRPWCEACGYSDDFVRVKELP